MFLPDGQTAKKSPSLVIKLEDHKEYKKLLRTRTNLLLIFAKSEKTFSSSSQLFRDVAEEMKGKATLAYMDCSESKKLCKKFKVSPSPLELKHYKDGDFNKDYDRKLAVKSMVSFLLDPTGDIPWQEDSSAQDIVHIDTTNGLSKLLRKEKNPMLVMFYAPWCGYCKKLKPDFAAAATEVKGKATLVGIDVDKPEQQHLRVEYNITGFPTIVYFENGKKIYNYGGENNKDGIVSWLNDPQPQQEKQKEAEWADEASNIVHLHDNDFEDYVQNNPSVLVMYYAPWCGHCKNMKPEYQEAASQLREEEIPGTIAAVDATKEKKLAELAGVKGFPTVKYYRNGEMAFDMQERTADKIVEFMKDPKEPPPPPPPEPNWDETESDVHHLTEETFKSFLKKKKHGLVMFYAPWCGHCKKAKPEFMNAATNLKEDSKIVFAALDCTAHAPVCSTHDVTGYPTFLYFNYGKNSQKYMGGREEPDFINFMRDPLATEVTPSTPVIPPSEDWHDTPGFESIEFLTEKTFDAALSQHSSVLVMFYAPWCGHCKKMKPDFANAAFEVRQQELGSLAAVDATAQSSLAQRFDVKGYPTLKHFKDGKLSSDYNRGRTAAEIVKFMKDPEAPPPPPPPTEAEWNTETKEVHFLTNDNFDDFVKKNEKVLVMFYAPWCGHCKKMKPDYAEAAAIVNKDVPNAKLAAVDVTKDKPLGERFEVKGFPTLKYFQNGEVQTDSPRSRLANDLVKFMKGPDSTPPTPDADEPEWKKTEVKEVSFLTTATFDEFIKQNDFVLVMFFAPWCGHCKKMKPDYAEAASIVNKIMSMAKLAAVDVTIEKDLATKYEVKGFPQLTLFTKGEAKMEYKGKRTKADLIAFMKGQTGYEPKFDHWRFEDGPVKHLNEETFKNTIDGSDISIVMFYAVWSGHCKAAKPKYEAAAIAMNDVENTLFAAVSCVEHTDFCNKENIPGHPTFRFYRKGKFVAPYEGDRTEDGFIEYMKNPPKLKDEL